MGFFKRDNREGSQSSDGRHSSDRRQDDRSRDDGRTQIQSFLSAFNTGAVACVVLPLFLLVITNLREGGGGGGGWFREEGSAARAFVYLWTMAVFVALARFANNEMQAEGGTSWLASWTGGGGVDARKAKTLVVALAMFANLCLLCTVLIAGSGDGGAEELGRSIGEGQFTGTLFLTFLFWLVWSLVSGFSLHGIATSGTSTSGGRDDDQNMGYICNPAV